MQNPVISDPYAALIFYAQRAAHVIDSHLSGVPPAVAMTTDEVVNLRKAIATLDTQLHNVRNRGQRLELHCFPERPLSSYDGAALAAAMKYHEDGVLEFDEMSVVSQSDGGAYVLGWQWVDDEEIETHKPSTPALRIELANHFVIRSGWIDKDDPDALPSGDYLAVDDAQGKELFYADTADMFADPVAGRRMLNEMLQSCLGLQVTKDQPSPTKQD